MEDPDKRVIINELYVRAAEIVAYNLTVFPFNRLKLILCKRRIDQSCVRTFPV